MAAWDSDAVQVAVVASATLAAESGLAGRLSPRRLTLGACRRLGRMLSEVMRRFFSGEVLTGEEGGEVMAVDAVLSESSEPRDEMEVLFEVKGLRVLVLLLAVLPNLAKLLLSMDLVIFETGGDVRTQYSQPLAGVSRCTEHWLEETDSFESWLLETLMAFFVKTRRAAAGFAESGMEAVVVVAVAVDIV